MSLWQDIMKAERVIQELMDILRADSLHGIVALEIALQALTLAKLSLGERLPEEYRLKDEILFPNADAFFDALETLSTLRDLGEDRNVFGLVGLRRPLSDTTVKNLQEFLLHLKQNGNLEDLILRQSIFDSRPGFATHYVPVEVVQLIVRLGGEIENSKSYCPYDELLLFASQLAKLGSSYVGVELVYNSPISWAIKVLNEIDVYIQVGDPVRNPSFLDNDGKLDIFDFCFAFPPMGIKFDPGIARRDELKRFPEETTSGHVLTVRHLMAQTRKKVVVAVPNSLLFSIGVEQTFRQDLLRKGMLEAVIGMPSGLLPNSGLSFSILVINMQGGVPSVRFVDGADDKFLNQEGRGKARVTLEGWKDLLTTYQAVDDESVVREIPVEEILQNEASLEVRRYVTPPEIKKIERLLANSEVCKLKSLVDFVRPSSRIYSKEEGIDAWEIGVSDFPDYGYLTAANRQVQLDSSYIEGKGHRLFLRPRDIVLAIKGSVGKVAIVPDDVPRPGAGGWLANQSCIILRSRSNIDPRLLYMYLRSDVGQILIERINSSGATVRLLQLKPLQELSVIQPSAQEADAVVTTFEKQVQLQKKILSLKREQAALDKAPWQIQSN